MKMLTVLKNIICNYLIYFFFLIAILYYSTIVRMCSR